MIIDLNDQTGQHWLKGTQNKRLQQRREQIRLKHKAQGKARFKQMVMERKRGQH